MIPSTDTRLRIDVERLGPNMGRLSGYDALVPYDDPEVEDARRGQQLRHGIGLAKYLSMHAPPAFIHGLLHFFQAGDPFISEN